MNIKKMILYVDNNPKKWIIKIYIKMIRINSIESCQLELINHTVSEVWMVKVTQIQTVLKYQT